MIIQGTVYSIDISGLRFMSKQRTGLILIFEGVTAPIEINLSTKEEIDRQYSEIVNEWVKLKKQ